MHIADGILNMEVLIGGGLVALAGLTVGLRSLNQERIPRVAVMSSAFFVASLIHVPLPPASAHLVLNGLIGVTLGWAAFPAILIGLFLQAVFFGHGGFSALGVNTANMAIPAVMCYYLFRPARRSLGLKLPGDSAIVFAAGFSVGFFAIALSTGLWMASLAAAGSEFLLLARTGVLVAIPLAVIEGLVTGFAVVFIAKARPELLRSPENDRPGKEAADASA